MSLFILPIAVVGLERMTGNSNPDMLVLTLPLSEGKGSLAMLAFLGGFSSATSMVIVETIALATMLSNHVVMPAWLWLRPKAALSGDLRRGVLLARRLSIVGVLALGLEYFRLSGGSASLAAIGMIAFAGMAQVLPALLGGIFWRGSSKIGAALGLSLGFVIWAYTLLLPSFGVGAVISADVFAQGLLSLIHICVSLYDQAVRQFRNARQGARPAGGLGACRVRGPHCFWRVRSIAGGGCGMRRGCCR